MRLFIAAMMIFGPISTAFAEPRNLNCTVSTQVDGESFDHSFSVILDTEAETVEFVDSPVTMVFAGQTERSVLIWGESELGNEDTVFLLRKSDGRIFLHLREVDEQVLGSGSCFSSL